MNRFATLSIAQLSTSLQRLRDHHARPWLFRLCDVSIEEFDRFVELFLLVELFHLFGDIG